MPSLEPATIMGTVAADLAHLIAELVEIALASSTVDHSVQIRGTTGATAATRWPSSTGGPGHESPAARRRRPPAGRRGGVHGVAATYLGHYVAGTLAGRHGIAVRMSPGEWAGASPP